jgi:hypothetical protein
MTTKAQGLTDAQLDQMQKAYDAEPVAAPTMTPPGIRGIGSLGPGMSGQIPPPQGLSDSDLDRMQAEVKPKVPANHPGGSPDTAVEGDLFKSDYNRARSSLGDFHGIKPMIEQAGYQNVQSNKRGEIVAQNKEDGNWYKDAQGLSHPINWLEGHAGGALPTAGMGIGSVVGGGMGALAGLKKGPAALASGYAGSVAGAGAGAAAGETARASLGKLFGVNDGPITENAGKEGTEAAISEAIGKPVMAGIDKIPGVHEATQYVADRTYRPLAARLSQLVSMGAVDYDSAMRLLGRPQQVMSSLKGDNVARVGEAAAGELAAKTGAERQAYDEAQRKFFKEAPPQVSTYNSVGAVRDIQNRPGYLPNSFDQGALTGDDVTELDHLYDSLTTPKGTVKGPWSRPPEITAETPLYRGKHPQNGKGNWTLDPNEAVAHASPQGKVQASTVGELLDRTANPNAADAFANSNSYPGKVGGLTRETFKAKNFPTDIDVPNPVRQASQSPEELVGTLQSLRQNAKPGAYTAKGAAKFRSDAMGGANKQVMGGLKDDLYGAGEPGKAFGVANDRFTNFSDDAESLKGLESPTGREGWASNLFGANKTEMREAAQRQLPKSYDPLADIGAYKNFDKGDVVPKILGPTGRAVTLGVLGGVTAPFHPVLGAAGATWALASHPAIQRQILNMGARIANDHAISLGIKNFAPWNEIDGSNEIGKKKGD